MSEKHQSLEVEVGRGEYRTGTAEEPAVAIDGMMHETAYFQPVPPGGEVFFIHKLEGS